MVRRRWVHDGDVVLVSLRDYQDAKCDIVDVYIADEVRKLQALGEVPQIAQIGEYGVGGGGGSGNGAGANGDDSKLGFVFEDI